MVEETKKDFTINLLIKSIHVEVTEQMPVVVIWQRGQKQASTKKRLINEHSPNAEFEEKFQINTVMEIDAEGKPSKAKMVSLFSFDQRLVQIDRRQ